MTTAPAVALPDSFALYPKKIPSPPNTGGRNAKATSPESTPRTTQTVGLAALRYAKSTLVPHARHISWFCPVGAPQRGQNARPFHGSTPHLRQTAAFSDDLSTTVAAIHGVPRSPCVPRRNTLGTRACRLLIGYSGRKQVSLTMSFSLPVKGVDGENVSWILPIEKASSTRGVKSDLAILPQK